MRRYIEAVIRRERASGVAGCVDRDNKLGLRLNEPRRDPAYAAGGVYARFGAMGIGENKGWGGKEYNLIPLPPPPIHRAPPGDETSFTALVRDPRLLI